MNKRALINFKNCVAEAPTGTYYEAKELDSVIGDTCDRLIKDIRALGLKADNCDLIYALEEAIYDYVKQSNPDSTIFPVAEGFGEAMDGPARDRVLAQTAADRDILSKLKPQ